MREKIHEKMKDILKGMLPAEKIDCISLDDNLYGAGIDSVIFIQLLVLLEDEYGFMFDDDMLNQEILSTMNVIIDYVIEKI